MKMPNIHQQLFIRVAAENVYEALTSAEGLSGWWTPGVSAKPELHTIARFPFGPNYVKEMEISELQRPRLVEWVCLKADEEWVGTHLSFELIEGTRQSLLKAHPEMRGQIEQQKNFDTGTVLIFHHDDWREYTPMFAECSYTWGQFLKSIKLYCETGKGTPWPNQH